MSYMFFCLSCRQIDAGVQLTGDWRRKKPQWQTNFCSFLTDYEKNGSFSVSRQNYVPEFPVKG